MVREKPGSGNARAQEEEGVYLHQDGKVKFAPVKTGLAGDTHIEIVSGLKDGQEIVTGPFRALRDLKDDAKVRKQEEEKKDEEKS